MRTRVVDNINKDKTAVVLAFCLTASISDLTASISLIASAYSSLYLQRPRSP